MNKYLRAVGFSTYKTKEELNKIFEQARERPDVYRTFAGGNQDVRFELERSYGNGIGLMWSGTVQNGTVHYEYCMPYVENGEYFYKDSVSVEERVMGNLYSGAFEDVRSGVFIIFCLQNGLDFVEFMEKNSEYADGFWVSLAGMSVSGTVLLPLALTERENEQRKLEQKKRIKLMTAAKMGDEKAMESLAYQDMDMYTKVSKRIRTEDIFSIVESSFMPCGIECDQYSIVANIVQAEKIQNRYTEEYVWLLKLCYNDININICINEADLLGEPKAGRRFKGNLWLLGKIKI